MLNGAANVAAADFREEPYWWNVAPPEESAGPVEGTYDVIVIGAGITGLRAAIDLAREGVRVLVCEQGRIGAGASRRNAGYLGRTLKKTFSELEAEGGNAYARAVYKELQAAYESTLAFIEREGIHCYANQCGRLIAATSPQHLHKLTADAERLHAQLGFEFRRIEAKDLSEEMGAHGYFGGIVIPDLGSLHPGLYHRGLYERAIRAGAVVGGGLTDLPLREVGVGGQGWFQ